MECPRCDAPLADTRSGSLCPGGHGRFVPAELLAHKHKAPALLAKAHATLPTSPCPACAQQMTLHHVRRIDVGVCPCGGIWLDSGEEKLLRERSGHAAWGTLELLGWLGAGLSGLG